MNNIVDIINNIHGGCFARIYYKSELPLLKEYENAGYKITKFTKTNCRIGVNYNNIGTVIERKKIAKPSNRKYTNNYEWITPNRIAYNRNTNEYYVQIATSTSPYSKSSYVLDMPGKRIFADKITDEMRQYIKPSYIGDDKKPISEVRKIKLNNVISVNQIYAEAI